METNQKFRKLLWAVTIGFFLGMLLLTIFARPIHRSMLTHVQTQRLEKKMFLVETTDEAGDVREINSKFYAVPLALAQQQEYYIVVEGEKNNEKRSFVKQVTFQLGEEQNGVVPILDADYNGEELVVSADGELEDGTEIQVD